MGFILVCSELDELENIGSFGLFVGIYGCQNEGQFKDSAVTSKCYKPPAVINRAGVLPRTANTTVKSHNASNSSVYLFR